MRQAFSAISFALVIGAAPAMAADLGSIKDTYEPPEPPVYNWTGLYIGGHAGYGWGDTDVDLSHSTGAIFYSDPFVPDQGSLSASDGFVGGIQVGAQKRYDRVVAGLEIDVSWTNSTSEGTFTTPLGSQWNITSDLEVFGTARGRLGYLFTPQLLAYATAGLAWGRVDVTQATTFVQGSGCSPLGSPACEGGRTSGKFDHVGYAVGGGLEYALDNNWSLKAEYLYIDLGDEDYSLKGTTTPGGSTPYVETFGSDLQIQTLRAGVNYRF